jgi:3-hydroxyisobutyrate dehydrogenase-like beta-hydroxyacid dehydrogenase
MRVDVIGLGAMGRPIAQRLAGAGYEVRGIDRDTVVPPSGEPADAVVCCVSDEAASREVMQGLFGRAAAGTLVIDHTTTSDAWAREAAERARTAGLRFCDAPLSGSVAAAREGTLVAMLGAHEADVAAARQLLSATTSAVVHLGPPGSGQLCKMANQLAIAGIAAGLAQAQAFGRAAGLDLAQVFQVLLHGSARSAQLERLHGALADADQHATATFAWLRKDLQLCAQASPRPLPVVALWQQLWREVE